MYPNDYSNTVEAIGRYDCADNKPCKGELTTDDLSYGGRHYQYPYIGDVSILP